MGERGKGTSEVEDKRRMAVSKRSLPSSSETLICTKDFHLST
jgi:hypothetical protein